MQGSHFEKENFISGWCMSHGTTWKFLEDRGKCGSHPVKSSAAADPILLDEETEAIIQGQRWF